MNSWITKKRLGKNESTVLLLSAQVLVAERIFSTQSLIIKAKSMTSKVVTRSSHEMGDNRHIKLDGEIWWLKRLGNCVIREKEFRQFHPNLRFTSAIWSESEKKTFNSCCLSSYRLLSTSLDCPPPRCRRSTQFVKCLLFSIRRLFMILSSVFWRFSSAFIMIWFRLFPFLHGRKSLLKFVIGMD